MKENFKEQFSNLKQIIVTNVATLKSLIYQADKLSELINSLTQDNPDSPIKQQLIENKKQIDSSIIELVKQTDKLFESYKGLVEEVFGK